MNDLERFKAAQDCCQTFQTALKEILNGKKWTHWIWFVFPQIAGLGHSEMARKYAIKDLLEAKAYLEDSLLRERLTKAAAAVLEAHQKYDCSMDDIFGSLDARKVRSCMTLFDCVAPGGIFQKVIQDCFGGRYCRRTLSFLGNQNIRLGNEL